MERNIEIGKIYKHFKGHTYKVIAIAYDSENYSEDNPELSKMVVYQNIENGKCWVRPYQMFNSLVDKDKYPDIKQEYRFDDITKEYKVSIAKSGNSYNLSKNSYKEFEKSPLHKDVSDDLSELELIENKPPHTELVSNWNNCHDNNLDFTIVVKEKVKNKNEEKRK